MIHQIYAPNILLLSYLLNYFERIGLMDRVVYYTIYIILFAIKIQGIGKSRYRLAAASWFSPNHITVAAKTPGYMNLCTPTPNIDLGMDFSYGRMECVLITLSHTARM